MILDLLKKRYSCRKFADQAVPPEIIDYIIECGRLSPSGGNEQPWKFGIVTDRQLIREIAGAASVNYDQSWIAASPLIIVLCTQIFDKTAEEIGMHRFPSFHNKLQTMDRDLYAIVEMEEHQTKIPGEHMVLAALEHGIYSTWVSSLDCEKVAALLGIEGYLVSNVLVFGYPAKDRPATPKKKTSDIVFTNNYKNTGFQP